MSFLGRLFGRRRERRAEEEARDLEREGHLARAADAFSRAGLGDEASRVLLLRSEAEVDPERRLALCLRAAEAAATDVARRAALARKARIALDLAIARKVALPSELSRIAAELEAAGDHERAADAYALARDPEGEVRALTAAGAIDRLEDRLRAAEAEARRDRAQKEVLGRIADLDACAERGAALAAARAYLRVNDDPRVAEAFAAVERRVLRGPLCRLEGADGVRTIALGDEVTIGRGDATVVIHARAASRRHLAIRLAEGGEVEVEDLATRNGTLVRGARLSGALRLAGRTELSIGGEVPCVVTPTTGAGGRPSGCRIEVAGLDLDAPLGPLVWRPGWTIEPCTVGDEPFVALRAAASSPAFRAGLQLRERIELSVGDEIAEERGGEAVLTVRAPPAVEGDSP